MRGAFFRSKLTIADKCMSKVAPTILCLLMVSISTSLFARGGWQQASKVSQLIIEGSAAGERVYVMFENNFNPDTCKGKDPRWIRVFGDTEKGKYLLTTVLSAKATGQTVAPLMHGCDDWGRPILTGLWIQ